MGVLPLCKDAVGVFYSPSRMGYLVEANTSCLFVPNNAVLFQSIQFSISTQFSSISPTDRTLSGAATLSQSGPVFDGNKEVLSIPQSSSITDASPSDCFVSYPGHSSVEFYPSAEMQSVYSGAPANCAFSSRVIFENVDFPLQHLRYSPVIYLLIFSLRVSFENVDSCKKNNNTLSFTCFDQWIANRNMRWMPEGLFWRKLTLHFL